MAREVLLYNSSRFWTLRRRRGSLAGATEQDWPVLQEASREIAPHPECPCGVAVKRRSGLGRSVPFATLEDLRGKPTKALLARLAHLRFCEESLKASDLTREEAQAENLVRQVEMPQVGT